MPQVHSSAEHNLSYNFETLHHARLKSPTVVIFEDTKHIVVDSFNSPRRWYLLSVKAPVTLTRFKRRSYMVGRSVCDRLKYLTTAGSNIPEAWTTVNGRLAIFHQNLHFDLGQTSDPVLLVRRTTHNFNTNVGRRFITASRRLKTWLFKADDRPWLLSFVSRSRRGRKRLSYANCCVHGCHKPVTQILCGFASLEIIPSMLNNFFTDLFD